MDLPENVVRLSERSRNAKDSDSPDNIHAHTLLVVNYYNSLMQFNLFAQYMAKCGFLDDAEELREISNALYELGQKIKKHYPGASQ